MTRVRLFLWLALALFAIAPATAQLGLPADKGLPVIVRVGVAFVALESFDEDAGTFQATVDIRVIWEDLRLRLPPDRALDPPLVFRNADAVKRLDGLWTPPIVLTNQVGQASESQSALRTFPDGRAELMRRVTATFKTPFTVDRFPFDRQTLDIEIAMLEEPIGTVALQTRQADLDFSRVAADVDLDGWTLGRVDIAAEPLRGWYGMDHARIVARLHVTRASGEIVAAFFIPLFASLLIPMLALWLNRTEDGVFQVETFELVNLIIGGLFAVIALNFTVNADYAVLASGDNAINRLFTLNYVTLGVCLLVNVAFYRFRVVEGFFGRWVQEQAYAVLTWLIPAIVFTAAIAIVADALA